MQRHAKRRADSDLAAADVRRVINLATFDPTQDPDDEAGLVRSLGMKYVSIPVDWDAPTRQDLEAFMQLRDQNGDEKVLVHCRANYRATAFIALYRILRRGWKPEEAFPDMWRIWNPEQYPVWGKFITEQLAADPASRTRRSSTQAGRPLRAPLTPFRCN